MFLVSGTMYGRSVDNCAGGTAQAASGERQELAVLREDARRVLGGRRRGRRARSQGGGRLRYRR